MTTTTEKGAPQVPGLLSRRTAARMAAARPPKQAAVAAPVTPAVTPAAKQASEARMAAIHADARSRVASAWTMAKTLLPALSYEAKVAFARALCSAPTPVVAAGLRATARMAHYTKAAEKFETETGRDLNEFVEDESELSKLNTEVLKENKADAPKTAAAPKKAGPEDIKPPVKAPAEVPPPAETPAAGTLEGTPAAPAGDFNEPAPAGDAAPGELGAGGAGADDAAPANEAMDAATEGSLMDSIETVEGEIQHLETEVQDAGDEALDLASIFNPEVQADKAQNLANENDGEQTMQDDVDFGPTDTKDMKDSADFGGEETSSPADFFKDASGPDPLSAFFGRQASEGVDVPMGDMAAHFETDLAGDDRDSETDNEGIFGEILESLKQPTRTEERDTEPHLEEPAAPQSKEANRRPAAEAKARVTTPKAPAKSSIRSVGRPTTHVASASTEMSDAEIARLILRDDE